MEENQTKNDAENKAKTKKATEEEAKTSSEKIRNILMASPVKKEHFKVRKSVVFLHKLKELQIKEKAHTRVSSLITTPKKNNRKSSYKSRKRTTESYNNFSNKNYRVRKNLTNYNEIPFNSGEVTADKVIEALNIPQQERNLFSNALVCNFLSKSGLKDKFEKDGVDKTNFDKMLIITSTYMKYVQKGIDEVIYTQEDDDEYIYIIIQGKVSLYTPVLRIEELNGKEYFNVLTDIVDKKDYTLLELITQNEANQKVFDISFDEAVILKKIMLKIRLLEKKENKPLEEDDFKAAKLSPEAFEIDLGSMSGRQVKDKLMTFLTDITSDHCDKLKSLLSIKEKQVVFLFEYSEKRDLMSGDFFGEGDLELNKYTQKAVSTEKTDLCVLSSDIYKEYMKDEAQKMYLKELSFILDHFFFSSIFRRKFEKEYMKFVKKDLYVKGQVLIKEDESVNEVYFIDKGSVEVSFRKNLMEVHSLINALNLYMYSNFSKEPHLDSTEKINEKNPFILSDEKFKKILANSSVEELTKEFGQKKIYRLFVLGKNEIFSDVGFYFGFPQLFTAKVISERAILFRISTDHLSFIFRNESRTVFSDFERDVLRRSRVLLERLISIENSELLTLEKRVEPKEPLKEEAEEGNAITRNGRADFGRLRRWREDRDCGEGLNSQIFKSTESVKSQDESIRKSILRKTHNKKSMRKSNLFLSPPSSIFKNAQLKHSPKKYSQDYSSTFTNKSGKSVKNSKQQYVHFHRNSIGVNGDSKNKITIPKVKSLEERLLLQINRDILQYDQTKGYIFNAISNNKSTEGIKNLKLSKIKSEENKLSSEVTLSNKGPISSSSRCDNVSTYRFEGENKDFYNKFTLGNEGKIGEKSEERENVGMYSEGGARRYLTAGHKVFDIEKNLFYFKKTTDKFALKDLYRTYSDLKYLNTYGNTDKIDCKLPNIFRSQLAQCRLNKYKIFDYNNAEKESSSEINCIKNGEIKEENLYGKTKNTSSFYSNTNISTFTGYSNNFCKSTGYLE